MNNNPKAYESLKTWQNMDLEVKLTKKYIKLMQKQMQKVIKRQKQKQIEREKSQKSSNICLPGINKRLVKQIDYSYLNSNRRSKMQRIHASTDRLQHNDRYKQSQSQRKMIPRAQKKQAVSRVDKRTPQESNKILIDCPVNRQLKTNQCIRYVNTSTKLKLKNNIYINKIRSKEQLKEINQKQYRSCTQRDQENYTVGAATAVGSMGGDEATRILAGNVEKLRDISEEITKKIKDRVHKRMMQANYGQKDGKLYSTISNHKVKQVNNNFRESQTHGVLNQYCQQQNIQQMQKQKAVLRINQKSEKVTKNQLQTILQLIQSRSQPKYIQNESNQQQADEIPPKRCMTQLKYEYRPSNSINTCKNNYRSVSYADIYMPYVIGSRREDYMGTSLNRYQLVGKKENIISEQNQINHEKQLELQLGINRSQQLKNKQSSTQDGGQTPNDKNKAKLGNKQMDISYVAIFDKIRGKSPKIKSASIDVGNDCDYAIKQDTNLINNKVYSNKVMDKLTEIKTNKFKNTINQSKSNKKVQKQQYTPWQPSQGNSFHFWPTLQNYNQNKF